MFIQIIQGRATNPPGIRRDLGRWQRQLAADADGWLGSTTGITEDGWSITVVHFASEAHAPQPQPTRAARVVARRLPAPRPGRLPRRPHGPHLPGRRLGPGRVRAGHPGS